MSERRPSGGAGMVAFVCWWVTLLAAEFRGWRASRGIGELPTFLGRFIAAAKLLEVKMTEDHMDPRFVNDGTSPPVAKAAGGRLIQGEEGMKEFWASADCPWHSLQGARPMMILGGIIAARPGYPCLQSAFHLVSPPILCLTSLFSAGAGLRRWDGIQVGIKWDEVGVRQVGIRHTGGRDAIVLSSGLAGGLGSSPLAWAFASVQFVAVFVSDYGGKTAGKGDVSLEYPIAGFMVLLSAVALGGNRRHRF
ncbi:hypothetical protein MLD38_006272 [Melastoma candidum]|uniref:Uncharacterized protein n=1 Tax=Melastoma candidum TaxID=119954 RepID=A0ACB9RRJ5_9MYRT|nr:hypothetical protein MLD38_006272 [Melastoma candidum]